VIGVDRASRSQPAIKAVARGLASVDRWLVPVGRCLTALRAANTDN